MSESDLEEARSEAELIMKLQENDVAQMFFKETMRRNLSRTVRHLDRLVQIGGSDQTLGESALRKLGFSPQH